MWKGFGQEPRVNIFASHAIPNTHRRTMFTFFSHLEENFASSRKHGCGTQDLCKGARRCPWFCAAQSCHNLSLSGEGSARQWHLEQLRAGPDSLHPSSGAWGWEKRWLMLPKCLLADPGTYFICSKAMHQSCLNRQVLLTHSRFTGGYVTKMKDYEMKEELINLPEVEGRQGSVSQAVHGDPSLPCGLSFLTAEAKYCRNKSHRADFGASKCWPWWFISLFNCKLPVSESKSAQHGHTSCLKFHHHSYRP